MNMSSHIDSLTLRCMDILRSQGAPTSGTERDIISTARSLICDREDIAAIDHRLTELGYEINPDNGLLRFSQEDQLV